MIFTKYLGGGDVAQPMIRTRGFPKKKEKGEEASLGARFLNLRRASSYILKILCVIYLYILAYFFLP